MLRMYDLPAPSLHDIPDYQERLTATVNAVVRAVEREQISGGQYEAVLIDEAHDFEPQWLALAAKMVDPDRRSLMIVYDNAQAIFKGREMPVWRRLGIDARGRTTVLKINYRNTGPILSFAALEDDVRLTYVAITRATHEAFLTYSRISSLVERLIA